MKYCPSCKKYYDGYGALSRKDNKTMICPSCGTMESLAVFMNAEYKGQRTGDEHNKNYCIFEKRICKYANNSQHSWCCEAPDDESMTCK